MKPALPKVSAPQNGLTCEIDTQNPSKFSMTPESQEYIYGRYVVQTCALSLFLCIFAATGSL